MVLLWRTKKSVSMRPIVPLRLGGIIDAAGSYGHYMNDLKFNYNCFNFEILIVYVWRYPSFQKSKKKKK